MGHGSCEPAHWYRQFDDSTDLKKLEEFIEKLKTEEEQAATVENVNNDDNEVNVIAEATETPDDGNDNDNDNNNDNDNHQAYDLADTSYVNEDISVHNAPDSDNIPTKLNDFFSDIDTRKEKLKQNYRGDEAIQRAVATLHQKIKKQNNGNIETFKRSVICLKWDTKHQFKLAKAEKGRMVGLFPIPVLVCYHTQDPESFFTEETELQLSDEDSMNLTY